MEPRCSPDGGYFLVLFCSGGFGGAKTNLGRLWGAKMVQHGAKMEPRWAMMVQHGTKMKPRWGQQASAVSLSVFALSFGGDKAKRNIHISNISNGTYFLKSHYVLEYWLLMSFVIFFEFPARLPLGAQENQCSSKIDLMGSCFQDMSFRKCSYGPYGPVRCSVEMILICKTRSRVCSWIMYFSRCL